MTTVDQILAGWPSTFDTMGDARKMQEMVEYARTLEIKLKDAEQQDEETRKLLSAERKRVKVLEDALNQIAAWHDGDTVGSHFDEPGSAEIAREALKGARV